ncbi:MAG: histidine kinase [Rhodocyclales bacterium]|nr:histidine kinase [Rhodocyclales bacterium]MDB5888582.1 histidine kinase [Rhodocyclales bacterium]
MGEPGIQDISSNTNASTLLLVDDEDNIISALRRLLRRDGYRILTANGGEAGLQVLEHEHVDVIVSDQRMPGMTGTEFLSRAREKWPQTIRIVLSGYTELGSVTSAINEGSVYKFLTKPWDDEQLRANIADAVRRKQLDDENRRLQLELASANAKLNDLLEERQRRIAIGEASLHVAHEVIAALPLAVLGVDNEYMIALANEAAQQLLGSSLIGLDARTDLPAVLQDILHCANPAYAEVIINGKAVRVVSNDLGSERKPRGRVVALFYSDTGKSS